MKKGISSKSGKLLVLISLLGFFLAIAFYFFLNSIFLSIGILVVSIVFPYLYHRSKMKFKIKFDKILKINLNSNDNTLSFTFLNENYAEYLNELNPSRKKEMEQKQSDEPSITQKSIMDPEKDKTPLEENLKDKPDYDIEKSLKEDSQIDLKIEKNFIDHEDVTTYPKKEIESFIVCPKCKTQIKSEMAFCFNCGTPLKKS